VGHDDALGVSLILGFRIRVDDLGFRVKTKQNLPKGYVLMSASCGS